MELVPIKSGAHAGQHQDYRHSDKETPLTQPVNSYVFEYLKHELVNREP
jgi:hypothetical protein